MKTRILLIIALMLMTCSVSAQESRASLALTSAIYEEEVTGNLDKAVELYLDILKKYPDDRPVAAKTLYHLGVVNEKMGKQKATEYFTRLVNTYPDQKEMVTLAKAKLAVLGNPAPASATMTARRLENPPADIPAYGAVSPSGRYLSYWGWETGDLILRDLHTGENRPLTSEGTEGDENVTASQWAGISAWSANSKQIAYAWNGSTSEDWNTELRIVGIDGAVPKKLFKNVSLREFEDIEWSPDGNYIAVLASKRDWNVQIILISTVNGSARVLTEFNRNIIYPANVHFLSGNRYLAYDRLPNPLIPERDIYLMNIESGEEIPLIQHPADDYLLGLSSDNKWLVFASDRTGALGLWVARIAGTKIQGEPKLIKPGIDRIVPIGMTSEGSLYYGVVRATEDVFVVNLDLLTGKVISPPEKFIESYEGGNFSPSYSPDGKYLAYVSRRGNSPYPTNVGNALCIRSLETGEERVFYKEMWRMGLKYVGGARWSPDGKYLIFGGSSGLSFNGDYRLDLQTGKISSIYLCSPGETLIGGAYGKGEKYFSARSNSDKGISQIVVHDIQSGDEKELLRYPRVERIDLELSPDGHWLSFLNAGWGAIRSLSIMPSTGGEVKEIYSFGETEQGTPTYNHTWSPDGKYILYSGSAPDKSGYALWRIPVKGGKPEELGLHRKWGIIHIRVSPDGRQLAFASRGGYSSDSELWILENFLPE